MKRKSNNTETSIQDSESSEPTNAQRRQRASDTLELYKWNLLKESGPIGADEIADLLTDLRHLCDDESEEYGTFLSAVQLSLIHFDAEKCAEKKTKTPEPLHLQLCRAALSALDAGNPEKVVKLLVAADEECGDEDVRKLMEKARKEADMGSLEKAEHFLNEVLL